MAKKMTKTELVFEIHKASPMYSTKNLNEMDEETLRNIYKWAIKPAKVIKDDSVYDSKGNKVVLEDDEVEESDDDILEPYDPNYLDDDTENPYKLSAWEKKFLRKVSILQNKLRKAGVHYEWLDNWQCFRVEKYINSDYPTYRYVRVNMEENDYSFGTEKEDLFFDSRVSEVVAEVKIWVNSKVIKK